MRRAWLALVLIFPLIAGCTADGASTTNFDLRPDRVGWYAGDTATFSMTISSSLLKSSPSFTIDRRFAIEEIHLTEKGLVVGGDYKTKNPDDIALTLTRGNETSDEFTLDTENPSLNVSLTLPADLRDSEYSLELKLFKVGWVKSDRFRVDVR